MRQPIHLFSSTSLIFALTSTLLLSPFHRLEANEGESAQANARLIEEFGASLALVVAARKTEAEVIEYANNFVRTINRNSPEDVFDIFLAQNGWLAITLGVGDDCEATLLNLKRQAIIPEDSYCSSARRYIAAFKVSQNKLVPVIGRDFRVAEGEEGDKRRVDEEVQVTDDTSTTLPVSAPKIPSVLNRSVQDDIVTKGSALVKRVSQIEGLPVQITYSTSSLIDFALVCDENHKGNFVGRYFLFMLGENQKLSMPYHKIEDEENYEHGITEAQYEGAVEFYYRNVYEDLSSWGVNFSRISVSENSYELSLSKKVPPNRHMLSSETLTVDRKTGVARKVVKDRLGSAGYRYDCKKMSDEWAQYILNLYEAANYVALAEDWLEAEAEFSPKRNQPSKF